MGHVPVIAPSVRKFAEAPDPYKRDPACPTLTSGARVPDVEGAAEFFLYTHHLTWQWSTRACPRKSRGSRSSSGSDGRHGQWAAPSCCVPREPTLFRNRTLRFAGLKPLQNPV